MDKRIFQHCARLRTNGIDDSGILTNLEMNGLNDVDAREYLYAINDAGITPESNSRPTVIGWVLVFMSILVIVAAGTFIALNWDDGRGPVKLMVIITAGAGVGFFFFASTILERWGIKTGYVKNDPNVTSALRFDFIREGQRNER